MNGSGKSNILDSICFVLGITNLAQVRAGNLSELVYKQGQAGVSKATVTVVFNNSNPASSPVGYEQCPQVTVTRQVLLGGKSKYLINGRNAPAGQVQNLFHSVQLNVNNPHFLIMQGRITKVLNMKPHEILGMVEEAAGTRMYETKRVAALKTMDKKQLKLDELQSVLDDEITPTLERLRTEKHSYLQWSKNNADVERLERFVVAAQYVQAVQACDSDTMDQMDSDLADLERQSDVLTIQLQTKVEEIDERSSQMQGEFAGSHKAAKQLEEKRAKELVKTSTAWQSSQDNVRKAESDLQEAQRLVRDAEAAVQAKHDEMQRESENSAATLQAAQKAQEKLVQLTTDYQNMSAGIALSQGDEGRTLPEQIGQAHSDSKTAEAKVQQAKLRIAHLSKELKVRPGYNAKVVPQRTVPSLDFSRFLTLSVLSTILPPLSQAVEKQIHKESSSSQKLTQKRDAASVKVSQLRAQLDQLHFSEDEYALLEREKQELGATVTELTDTVETLQTRLGAKLAFKYQDPVRGFDRSKVKGLVSRLIAVRDAKNATALEVVAGGKLYQVVVDEAITGKALLDRGKLERRVTLIPLDKIKPRQLGRSACDSAASIASNVGATATPAIDLVDFDEEVRSAIEYVFGATIVVDDPKAANLICDATKTRTVTLEGDTYDPSGTISGGSRDQLGSTLSNLYELKVATQALDEKQARYNVVNHKLQSLETSFHQFEKVSRELEFADAELKNAEKHLSHTSFGILVEKRDAMTVDLKNAQRECTAMETEKIEKWALYEDLKARETELTQERENRLVQIEQALQAAKVEAAEKSKFSREVSLLLRIQLESFCDWSPPQCFFSVRSSLARKHSPSNWKASRRK